ncbi:magnesium transporter CorA family protein [Candidatus Microgenomates bacterium]|nr:magnesium transporter CorA family protein [Candidatus Microgenomates bacterium]
MPASVEEKKISIHSYAQFASTSPRHRLSAFGGLFKKAKLSTFKEKYMAKTLKETLKEIQIMLGKPQRKLAGALKYYLNFLSVGELGEKDLESNPRGEGLQTIQYDKIIWVDVKNPTRRDISQLAQKYPFHPLHLEDCISGGQFPKIEQNDEDGYIFLLLRFPQYSREKGISISQICFFLGKSYLVSIHENSGIISNIFKDCQENPQQREAYIDSSSAHLFYTIINRLTDELPNLLQAVSKEVDETEDIVFDDKVSGAYKIGQLRHKILRSRRAIGPLRILLDEMSTRINKFSEVNLSVYFENIADQINKTWDTLEEARETVEIYKDADFIISSEKTNKVLAVLTIIFTFTIPATVVGTFYGMNIRLPGGIEEGSPWLFFGNYTAFMVVLIVAAIPTIIMYLYFRMKDWI